MPQLIAMVIVVVAAMIYMFQTFGGTGDKIEGIAQKTSVVTEINNIKNGLKLAARAQHISTDGAGESAARLEGLAELAYFPEQVNQQLDVANQADTNNVYQAISFGADNSMEISMVNDVAGAIPGIYVDLTQGTLAGNAGFLEAQLATDLEAIAIIDRGATSATAGALRGGNDPIIARTPADNGDGGANNDGRFIIYFNDFGANEVVR